MNSDDMQQPREFSDANVSAGYRALPDEDTPGHLDAKIMLAARNAAVKQTGIFRITAWLRPLAFAATAGLSIALLLEINESQILGLSVESHAPTPAGADSSAAVPDSAATDSADTDRFRDAAGQALEQVREIGASEDATLKEMPKSTSEGSIQESSGCTTEQRSNPGDWMACIDELERSGMTAIADRELAELRQSFPHFLVQ